MGLTTQAVAVAAVRLLQELAASAAAVLAHYLRWELSLKMELQTLVVALAEEKVAQ
jgi:hypothetical protein